MDFTLNGLTAVLVASVMSVMLAVVSTRVVAFKAARRHIYNGKHDVATRR